MELYLNNLHISYFFAGKKKVKNMNTYLKLLVDELKNLCTIGVEAWDASSGMRSKFFQLHAIMILDNS